MKLEDRHINPYKMFVGSFVPNWLLKRTEVSQGAKLAYARLAQYAGDHGVAFPMRETIAAELGISESQFDRYMRELAERHGLIEITRFGLGRANRYRFLKHPWIDAVETQESAYTLTQESASTRTPLKRIIRRESEEDIPQGFEDFWKAYPKKINRLKTEKAWNKLRPDKELRDRILAALEEQKTWTSWTKENGQYVPYPTTWLNGRRWEDEASEREEPRRPSFWDRRL